MAVELKMPALSPTMEEGTLAKWLVSEGDTVKSGDILAEIETDKATMEFEAIDEGTIAEIVVPAGTEGVKVGAVIARIAEEGEDASAAKAAPAPKAEAKEEPKAEAEAPKKADVPAPEGGEQTKMETGARDLVAAVADTRVDPEVPEGTELVKTTVREALRDAMAEEMRKDGDVFVNGRGSRAISGRL